VSGSIAYCGSVWRIEEAPEDYVADSEDEAKVLQLLAPQHVNTAPQQQQA
jgi:hypothetical protein